MSFVPFGTAHEALEDEQNTAVSRKPKRIEDEVVTDEKGRRRFHGAFTGGFSAGYFNTVGSKVGWEPQTFKSTRNERAEKVNYAANDFMDEEDRGEYGFAARKIKARGDFSEKITDGGAPQSQLAWERAGPSISNAPVDYSDLAAHLEKTIHPVNDSIGIRILKKMGWRPGKGIGPRMSRRALEKQKVLDARSRGESTRFDERAVKDVEENAPEIEFAPDDIPRLFFIANDGQHGIGYKPLERSNVLDETFVNKVDALKTRLKSRGIKGQAFGVGAFEEDDDDVYTSTDLSKYDYAIGGNETAQSLREIERYDSNFVPASKTERPVFYRAPQPSKNFNPRHKPEPIKLVNLPKALLSIINHLTPLQKAVFLGDRTGSVMELLNDSDREKLKLLSRKSEKELQFEKKKEIERRHEPEPFEEEPLKAHRFKKYVHYLKSGFDMPPPMEVTQLEWEKELAEFQNQLTPELRSLLPSVRSRQEPLANLMTAQPIAELFKSRFKAESSSEAKNSESKLEAEKRKAVKENRFGDITRTKYKWHPSKLLCKFFNVEDPYPDSSLDGTAELQKYVPPPKMSTQLNLIGNLGLPNTQRDVMDRLGKEAHDRRHNSNEKQERKSRFDQVEEITQKKFNVVEKPVFLPPIELLQSVFELPELEESSSSSESEEDRRPPVLPTINKVIEKPVNKQMEKFITILDLVPDDDEYGPKIPESLAPAIPPEQKVNIVPLPPRPEVVQIDSSDESSNGERVSKKRKRNDENGRHNKKEKKEKKKDKKKHKSKKPKKGSKRHHSTSS